MSVPANDPRPVQRRSGRNLLLNLVDSGHQFDESELGIRFKFRFLNSVFAFACVVAFALGTWRLITFEKPIFVFINFTFTALSIALLVGLRMRKENIEFLSSASVVLSYLLFTATYVLIAGEARNGLYFLLVGAAFFLKGRRHGFRWLLFVIATVVGVEVLPWSYAKTSAYGTVTFVIYLIALYLILRLYENQKEQDQERIEENEEKFRALFDTSSDGILLLDGTQILQTNQAARQLFGLAERGLQHLDMLSPPKQPDGSASAEGFKQRVQASLQQGGQFFEWQFLRADGGVFYGDVNLSPLHVGGKRYVQAVIRDIDMRKQAELELDRYRNQLEDLVRERTRRLEQSESRFARLLEITEEGILIHDKGILIDVSDSLCRMTGYAREELLGQNFIQLLVHPDSRQISRDYIDANGTKPLEVIGVRRDGTQIYVEVVGRFIEIGDRQLRAAAVRNITNRKQAEQAIIRAKEAAEAATQAKSAFIANMSHEIRTPMNAILGLTHQLRRESTDAWQGEQLDKISSAGQHLLSIINDILDLSKIEAGKITLAPEDFSLPRLMNRVVTLIRDLAERKGLSVEMKLDDNIPTSLRGDEMRLSQVLVNLAGNAVKFTERGSVFISARCVAQTPEGFSIRFLVKDSGIGITHEQISRLFVAFEQAEGTTSRKHGGTGLGLAISQRFVQLMGGKILVKSQPGEGSEFWFDIVLPLGRQTGSPATSGEEYDVAAVLQRHHQGARILLVEDNAINQEVALDLLNEIGLNADVADDGKVAVQMASERPYDLILMDLQMPEMDGFEASTAIRQLPGHTHTPILAMTANAFDEDRERCLQAGMNGHVAKPINPDTLFAAILNWLPQSDVAGVLDLSASGLPPARDPLRQRLDNISGLDIEAGLVIARGKLERYRQLLHMFVEHNGDYGSRIVEQLREAPENIEEAGRLSHSLKGICGTLGMFRIGDLAAEVEALCKTGTPREQVTALALTLEAEITQLKSDISTYAGDS